MPQFTPSDRKKVHSVMEGHEQVADVTPHGTGLMIVRKKDRDHHIATFSGLAKNHGWYVSTYDKAENGDVFTVFPFTGGSL